MGCQLTSAISMLMSVFALNTSYIIPYIPNVQSYWYELERRWSSVVFTGANRICSRLFVDLFVASIYPPLPTPPRQQTPVATVASSVISTSCTQVYYIVYTLVYMCYLSFAVVSAEYLFYSYARVQILHQGETSSVAAHVAVSNPRRRRSSD